MSQVTTLPLDATKQSELQLRFEECKKTFQDGSKIKVTFPGTVYYGRVFTVKNVIQHNTTIYIKTVEMVGGCPALILAEWCAVHVDEDKQCLKYKSIAGVDLTTLSREALEDYLITYDKTLHKAKDLCEVFRIERDHAVKANKLDPSKTRLLKGVLEQALKLLED